MKNNPFYDYIKELLTVPIINFVHSLLNLKKFVRTLWNIIYRPNFIFVVYDINKLYTPINFSKETLKVTIWAVTIFIFSEFYGNENNFISLVREYLIILIYIISILLMIALSYVFNNVGNYMLNNSMLVANAFVNYFNSLFIGLLFVSFTRLKFVDFVHFFLLIPFLYGIYYIYKIGRKLKFRIWKTVIFSISASLLIILLLMINLTLLTDNLIEK